MRTGKYRLNASFRKSPTLGHEVGGVYCLGYVNNAVLLKRVHNFSEGVDVKFTLDFQLTENYQSTHFLFLNVSKVALELTDLVIEKVKALSDQINEPTLTAQQ